MWDATRNLIVAVVAVLAAAVQSAPLAAAIAAAEDLYVTHANIVDPATRTVRQGNLLISQGVIVSTPDEPPAGFTGRTLDAGGKWVIPGLVDVHVHAYGNMDAKFAPVDAPLTPGIAARFLYAGVTAFLDLGAEENQNFATRAALRAGKLEGADMFAALTAFTVPDGHGTEFGAPTRTASTPDEVRRSIEDLAPKRPDVIKIIYEPGLGSGTGRPSFDKKTFTAAVAAAKAHGFKTVVHVGSWQNIRDAIEVGADVVTHVPTAPIPAGLARLMAAKHIVSIPTLAVQTDSMDFVTRPEVLDQPLARAVTIPRVIDSYRAPEVVARFADGRAEDERAIREILASVRSMSEAGVRILAGSDSGSRGTLHGYSLHRELIKLVGAGMSPWQALAAATTDAGDFLGRKYGVQPGDEANLVVLDASPIEDIRNTQRIALVIHHGTVVDREKLIASDVAGLRRK